MRGALTVADLMPAGQVDVLQAAIRHQSDLFQIALDVAREAGLDVEPESD